MAEIKRRKTESFEAFMRRAKQRIQQSGKVLQVKKIRFYTPNKSKNMRRRSALHRLDVADNMAYLKKVGRLKEDTFKKKF